MPDDLRARSALAVPLPLAAFLLAPPTLSVADLRLAEGLAAAVAETVLELAELLVVEP